MRYLLNKEGSKRLTNHYTNILKYKKKITITNITNISTDQVVIEFSVSQMRLQLTKSVIFAGVCCLVSQLSTFHSENYLLFSCKEKVNIWGKRNIESDGSFIFCTASDLSYCWVTYMYI